MVRTKINPVLTPPPQRAGKWEEMEDCLSATRMRGCW